MLKGEKMNDNTTDDLIRRRAAIAALGKRPTLWIGSDYEIGFRNRFDMDSLAIDTVPPVDAVPVRRGKWIKNEFGSRCACCGLYAYRYENGRPWESDYCPYCGADMRGEQP